MVPVATNRRILLLVAGQPALRHALQTLLQRHGYEVAVAHDSASAVNLLSQGVDLIFADVCTQGAGDLGFIHNVRLRSYAPVIVALDRVKLPTGLRGLAEADDFMIKPYTIREVLLRAEVALSRCSCRQRSAVQERIAFSTFTLNIARRQLNRSDGCLVQLTRREFDLLVCLARRGSEVVARRDILQEVWGQACRGSDRTLEVHVASLRRKLRKKDVITTVRGVGYRITCAASEASPDLRATLITDTRLPGA